MRVDGVEREDGRHFPKPCKECEMRVRAGKKNKTTTGEKMNGQQSKRNQNVSLPRFRI